MTLQISEEKFKEFYSYLESRDFSFEERQHQVFLAKGKEIAVNLYNNGKIVIGGKNLEEREKIEQFLKKLEAKQVIKQIKEYPPIEFSGTRIGTDEAGKGDYFGPLVIAGALITEYQADELIKIGVRDSKSLSDTTIQNLGVAIRRVLLSGQYEVISITPVKYNILYKKMKNVNAILGWGHARAIENLLMFKEPCEVAIADQFGDQSYIYSALMKKGRDIELTQVPKAEREISVATASVLARSEFVNKIREMGESYGVEFPKGATHVLDFAQDFVEEHGFGALQNVAKIHFATTDKIKKLKFREISEDILNLANTESAPILYEEKEKEDLLLECYNLISNFESEFRRFLKGELQSFYGDQWWEKSIDKNIRGKCEKLQKAEMKKGREVEPIDCMDFNHYQMIITDKDNWEKVFSNIFKNKDQLLARLKILKDVRDPVAHSRGSFMHKDKLDIISTLSYFRKMFKQKKIEDFDKKTVVTHN
jgi:ribonuclease HIII